MQKQGLFLVSSIILLLAALVLSACNTRERRIYSDSRRSNSDNLGRRGGSDQSRECETGFPDTQSGCNPGYEIR